MLKIISGILPLPIFFAIAFFPRQYKRRLNRLELKKGIATRLAAEALKFKGIERSHLTLMLNKGSPIR